VTMPTSGYSERNNPFCDKTLTPVKISTGEREKKTPSPRVQARIYHQSKNKHRSISKDRAVTENFFFASFFVTATIRARLLLNPDSSETTLAFPADTT